MSFEQVFMALLGVFCGGMGWFGRELYSAMQKLKDDLAKLEVKIGTDYVRYDRLQDALKPVIEKLEHIQRDLNRKADRIDQLKRGHDS